MSAFCRRLGNSGSENVLTRRELCRGGPSVFQYLKPCSSLARELRRSFTNLRLTGLLEIQDQGLMRSAEVEWHDCVAPIPKDACTGFDEARGEFFAYPTGRSKTSRRHRASHIGEGHAGTALHNRAKATVSDSGSNRSSDPGEPGRTSCRGRPSARVWSSCRSFVPVFLWHVVASAARCQRRMGINSIPAITG
jgi:hypothetical protein